MKFFNKGTRTSLAASEAVDMVMSNAVDYYSGELETLRSKQEKLTEFVAAILDAMPEDQALEVLQAVGGSNWTAA